MSALKKFFKYIVAFVFSIAGLISVLIVVIAVALFIDPILLINPRNIDYALKKTSFLKSWSWKSGTIKHKWIKWNHRHFDGSFQNLCLEYVRSDKILDTCMEDISWNLDVKWQMNDGFSFMIKKPLSIESSKTKIALIETDEDKEVPDYLAYWKFLWSKSVPDLDFKFKSIELINRGDRTVFDLKLLKKDGVMNIEALDYKIKATPEKITVFGPQKILIPYDLKTRNPLYLNDLILNIDLVKNDVLLNLKAGIETAHLEFRSEIPKRLLKKNIKKSALVKTLLLNTSGDLHIEKINAMIARLMKPPFHLLPAPFNAMEGTVKIRLETSEDERDVNKVLMKIISSIDMLGAGQLLDLELNTDFPYDFKNKSIGPLVIGIELKKVSLRLPKLSKSKLPPQWRPDPRFKKVSTVESKKRKKKRIDFKMSLEAIGDNTLAINTNLLDQTLKLNFQLEIENKTVEKGYISAWPLKTSVFKRPIFIPDFKVVFDAPREPEINTVIEFHLPEYLVTLKLEGPLSKPRQAFSSKPPLQQDDIIAVILFGRPLSSLDAEGKTATKNVSQIISQGILSLAVLYYLAGSPVESIGYDPDTKAVSAQFGLGRKDTLHISSERAKGGMDTYGIRHSLGKGWYIDSTVQRGNDISTQKAQNDYGVLLERIKSY